MEARDVRTKVNQLIDTYWDVLNQIAGTADFRQKLLSLRWYGDEIKLHVLPVMSPKAFVQYRKEGLYLDLCGRLEKAVNEHSFEIQNGVKEIRRQRPAFRIGIFIFCSLPGEVTIPQASISPPPSTEEKEESSKPTANDRRFLRSLRIAAD